MTIILSLALTGCLSAEPADDRLTIPDGSPPWVLDALQQPVAPEQFPGEFPSFGLVKVTDRSSGEPTIGVTRTGSIFYAAYDLEYWVTAANRPPNRPHTHFLRSSDGGDTWLPKNPRLWNVETHPFTDDPYLYVDPTTGRVYAVDMAPSLTCNRVSWSDDDGESWMTREGACVPGVNDHPTLFAGPATALTNKALYPNQLYLCVNRVTDTLCYQSGDGGISWTPTTPLFVGLDPERGSDGLCSGSLGHGHAAWADGTVYVGRGWCGEPMVAVSRDGGVTFTTHLLSSEARHRAAEHDVMVQTDADGIAYALWVGDGQDHQGRAVFLSRSKDQGRTWSEPINVTAPAVTAVKLPNIIAGSTGRIAFLYVGTETPSGWGIEDCSYEDRTLPTDEPVCMITKPDEHDRATWNAYIGFSMNAYEDGPIFATTRANPIDAPLKRGNCLDRCFGDRGGMYDFLDIDIDPKTGRVFAALVDVCSGDCDGPDKRKSEVYERSVGVIARQVGGVQLLTEPSPSMAALDPASVYSRGSACPTPGACLDRPVLQR